MARFLLVVILGLPAAAAIHDSSPLGLEVMSERLPFGGFHSASAVWDGARFGYVFGGSNNTGPDGVLDSILRYEPSTGSLEEMEARLPTARAGTSAAWVGGYAYIFGGARMEEDQSGGHGHGFSVVLDEVVRYDPRADTVQVMTAKLPSARWGTSAVSDGTSVYVFGGHDGDYRDDLLRYDPKQDSLTESSASFPVPIGESSAVWTGTYAYIWGEAGSGYWPNRVYRYDPGADVLSMTEARTPSPRFDGSSIWDGQHAYLFGGRLQRLPVKEILRFDPSTDQVVVLGPAPPAQDLRPGRAATAAFWTGTYAFVFGGEQIAGNSSSDQILRFHPGPDAVATTTTPPSSGGQARSSAAGGIPSVDAAVLLGTLVLLAHRKHWRG